MLMRTVQCENIFCYDNVETWRHKLNKKIELCDIQLNNNYDDPSPNDVRVIIELYF